jgi:molybdenum cofactor cytidylyltransferase
VNHGGKRVASQPAAGGPTSRPAAGVPTPAPTARSGATIVPLILAGGRGERLGSNKALIDVGGRPALQRVLETAAEAGLAPPVVVLGFAADQVGRLLTELAAVHPSLRGVKAVVNPTPERGQTSSVQAGLAAVPADSEAVLLWPVDHPLVEADDVAAILSGAAAHPECTVILPSVGGRAGHPALLRRRLFSPILALDAAQPLRDLVRSEQARTHFVALQNDALVRDIDTDADLAAARRQLSPAGEAGVTGEAGEAGVTGEAGEGGA